MNKKLLDNISMVTANYGEGIIFPEILQDWFNFLGGKPGEVVYVDCGSDPETQTIAWQLFQEGIIDKIQLIHPTNDDFGKEQGYIKEYTAAAISSKPYILTMKLDTLPYRQGHNNWLSEAIGYLDKENIFSISGSWNLPSKHSDAWPGWYFSKKCSYNFALMKRSRFMTAAHEFAGPFIAAGFKGENPAKLTNQDRYLTEVAFERYIETHNLYTLCKIEDDNWTVFHVNTHDEELKKIRTDYLNRKKVKRYINIGYSDQKPQPEKALYYGQPGMRLTKKLRVAFGKTMLGSSWRSLKQKFS